MRTSAQLRTDRALVRILLDAAPYLMPEAALKEEITLRVIPRPSAGEVEDSIRHADTERRLVAVRTEGGLKYKLSEAGQAWAQENL